MKRIAKKLLGYFEHGEKTYIEFRNERFADKTKALSDVIKKVSLPSFESKSKESTKFKPSKENTKAKILSHCPETGSYCQISICFNARNLTV